MDPANRRTISWEHIVSPKVTWKLVEYTDLLRTADGKPPHKSGAEWVKDMAPDLAKSKQPMKHLLVLGGCAQAGTNMIACGIAPCGEPCLCQTGVSNHINGLASDLHMHDLDLLTRKLHAHKAGTLDRLLEAYGLHRPLLHHHPKPEEWHIEAIPAIHHIHRSRPAAHHHAHQAHLEARDLLEPCPRAPRHLA